MEKKKKLSDTIDHNYMEMIAADAGLEMSAYMAVVKEMFLDSVIITSDYKCFAAQSTRWF